MGSHISKIFSSNYNIVNTGRNVDIRDVKMLQSIIDLERPNDVINLAAITSLKESFDNPCETYDVNFGGTLNLLMALNNCGFTGRLIFVSTSEVYGLINESSLPLNESMLTKPLSPYAVAKLASESLCYQWSRNSKFKIVVARPFNHIGPGQSDRFAISDFARQIAMIKLGLAPPIMRVGNIDNTRDFTDVRDVVSAYKMLLDFGENGEVYNVCSGFEQSIRSLIERMCQLAGVIVQVQSDSARLRQLEQLRVCGDNQKLVKATGWSASYCIDETLKAILEDWMIRFGAYAN